MENKLILGRRLLRQFCSNFLRISCIILACLEPAASCVMCESRQSASCSLALWMIIIIIIIIIIITIITITITTC